jgi:hypothetical protein
MHDYDDYVALPCTAASPSSNRRQPHMPATREGIRVFFDPSQKSSTHRTQKPKADLRLKISTHDQVGVGVYFSASANETGTLIVKSIIKGSPAFKSNKISVTGNPLP